MTDKEKYAFAYSTVKDKQIALDEAVTIEEKALVNETAITLKSGDSFLIMDVCGDLLLSQDAMGLFRQGTRFLNVCNLFLEGQKCVSLSHQTAHMSNTCHIDLTNVPLQLATDTSIEQGVIHVDRFVELSQNALLHTFTVTNFHTTDVSLTLSLTVGADFCDLFEVRGVTRAQHGSLQVPQIDETGIRLSYLGLDQIERRTTLNIDPPAHSVQDARIDWRLDLKRGKPLQIKVSCALDESSNTKLVTAPADTLWKESQQPLLRTDEPFFNQLLDRGIQDIMMLSTMTAYGYYPYAGIPWYNCPFGRDGLIAALEFLPFYPQIARGTLAFLASYQGTKVDDFTDEEPGKILHEFRTGEMAACREVPYIPYYGTVDATPLFLILFEAYIRWTNDQLFLEQFWPHIEAAVQWMVNYGDKDGDTFLEYHRASGKGLDNQGWKDAGDSMSHSDGRIARSPLALSEVQGYAYAAYRATSYLAHKADRPGDAQRWDQRSEEIQQNFLQRYWWDEEQSVYLALDANKEPCDVVASNAGQCLWTGILPDDKAQQIIKRMLQPDMFSGWGIRTLSSEAARYNPLSYHNGSIWPHDTALIGTGFALYGEKESAGQLLKSLFDASRHFIDARLPELFCGFVRRPGYGPTRYPVSCSPQAWSAGAPHILLTSLLGMAPDASKNRLTLHQPTLPRWLTTLEIDELFVGSQRVHLRFTRHGTHTEVTICPDNQVDIRIQ